MQNLGQNIPRSLKKFRGIKFVGKLQLSAPSAFSTTPLRVCAQGGAKTKSPTTKPPSTKPLATKPLIDAGTKYTF